MYVGMYRYVCNTIGYHNDIWASCLNVAPTVKSDPHRSTSLDRWLLCLARL